jgi:hypothetical protein
LDAAIARRYQAGETIQAIGESLSKSYGFL